MMHRLSNIRNFGQKISQAVGLRAKPIPAWPLRNGGDVPEIQDQLQSPFFAKLSIELRILIYELVLGDSERYLHICLNRGKKAKKHRKVAHWRCDEMDSTCPTWQHWCFGDHPPINRRTYEPPLINPNCREITITKDRLVAILLCCRRIYSEALAILYQGNIFHFRGPHSLPAFRKSIPIEQWNAIRNIHISSANYPFYRPFWDTTGYKDPKTLPNWFQICQELSTLPNLQSLSFDLCLFDPYLVREGFWGHDAGLLSGVLKPLKAIRASKMIVEANCVLRDCVATSLGPVDFDFRYRRWEYRDVFRDHPLSEFVTLEKIG